MKHVLLASALCLIPVAAQAQATVDDLIAVLRPTPGGPSRGIKPGAVLAPVKAAAPFPGAGRVPGPKPQGQASMTVGFETGSARLAPAAVRSLDMLGQALVSPDLAPDRFRIVGHTDAVGNPDRNQVLSQRRAEAVVGYLSSRFGIDPARLSAVGVGQTIPLVPTAAGVAAPENRRVQVVNLGT